ncbi:MAG TPA: ATP-dependent Clp protease proteolytic subunit [Candidatus Methylacidiphilales bacterium]|jgi:ATP-dependent Clp protease protease subunit|nr:ATP-dependent Clp protease proteolytic subunit [Candidatus Methylacidiphilales bacterium]
MDFQFDEYKLRAQRLEDDDEDEEEEEPKGKKGKPEDNGGGGKLEEKILETRTILLFGEISQKSAREVCQKLILLSALNDNPIKLIINSQGGHVEAGDTIHDMIRFVKPKVKILGTGWVASAGALIYVAVPVEQRFSLQNTRYMLHQPSGGVGGQATDISIEAQEILKMRDRLNNLFAKQTGQPVERIEKDTDRNFWMSAEEAKQYGLVGKIISSQADY